MYLTMKGKSVKSRLLRNLAGSFLLLIFFLVSFAGIDAAELISDGPSFSPNSDGFHDQAEFQLIHFDYRNAVLENWTFRIFNKTGKPVRTIKADRRSIQPEPSFSNFFLPSVNDTKPLLIFDKLTWDGRDDESMIVPDGNYEVRLEVKSLKGKFTAFELKTEITVDTEAPSIEISAVSPVIVRSAAAKPSDSLDEISILQKSKGGYQYSGKIFNSSMELIEERKWTDELPEKIFWNGKSKGGEFVPYGNYLYSLTAVDGAGNISEKSYSDLMVIPENAPFYLSCGGCIFNSEKSTVRFQLKPLSEFQKKINSKEYKNSLFSWELGILKEKGNELVFLDKGRGLPSEVSLAGQNNILSEGNYRARIVLRYQNESFESVFRSFNIDSSPPDVAMTLSGNVLSHDGDNENEQVNILLNYSDIHPPASWRLTVTLLSDSKYKFRKKITEFSGRFIPEKIVWKGAGDKIQLNSFEKIELSFSATDYAGSKSREITKIIYTDGLIVNVSDNGDELRIEMPVQGYFKPEQKLTERMKENLNRIVDKLKRYSHYSISVETHESFPGREEENLNITEIRSKNIYDYLILKKISPARMEYRGLGETELKDTQDEPFIHYRNERIVIRMFRIH